ncbi:MAG: HAD family hydrolase [Candidatus Bathyarchaeota archaeon]|nr:HAD family hydrolase [Candidatus Bathyarchaeota archaeon]
MTEIKAVITDYIGTLTNARNYSLETSRTQLQRILTEAGFDTSLTAFLAAYNRAHEKYRRIRYEQLREVTNAVWVSEALNTLSYQTTPEDPRLKAALNIFFQHYVDTLELRPHAKSLLRKLAQNHKLGLISNFTYAPAIHASLRKLDINHFFNAIIISEDIGWRKPHKLIFQTALQKLHVTPEETMYIGDSPKEDIEGAKTVGIKTIFVPSQFYSTQDLREIHPPPDIIAEDLQEICENLNKILTTINKKPTQNHNSQQTKTTP